MAFLNRAIDADAVTDAEETVPTAAFIMLF